MVKPNFHLKVEDLPVVGDFVFESFETDKSEFIAFSQMYGDGFSTSFSGGLTGAKDIIMPETFTNRMKAATTELHGAEDNVGVHIGHLERYAEMAGNTLSVNLADFNLGRIRLYIRNRNAEGLIKAIRVLLQVIAPCIAALESKGYTAEKQAELVSLLATIERTNKTQNKELNDRRRLVEDNMQLLNDFWLQLTDVMKSGKVIFKDNPVKKAEYTQTEVVKRVNAARRKKDESPTVAGALK